MNSKNLHTTPRLWAVHALSLKGEKLTCTDSAAPSRRIFEKNACTIAVTSFHTLLSGLWTGRERSFHLQLQGEKPPLLEVPEEAAEDDGAADPRYGQGPLERVGHREKRDLEVHAENPRDHPEDGHHECGGGQEQLELDQLVPDVILQQQHL